MSLEFSPFNIGSGPEFLGIYFISCAVGLAALAVARRFIVAAVDRRLAPIPLLKIVAAPGGDPYRTSAATRRERLSIGWIPQPDELPAIAWLQQGRRGVANLLIAAAVADGWLSQNHHGAKTFAICGLPSNDEPLTARFHGALSKQEQALDEGLIQSVAMTAASDPQIEEGIEADLRAGGLLRAPESMRAGKRFVLAGGVLLLAVGALRALRDFLLTRPITLLVLEMIAVAVGVLALAYRQSERTAGARKYLSWLGDATVSLRTDVVCGRRQEASEIALVAAFAGAAALSSVPLLAALPGIFVPETATTSPIFVMSTAAIGASYGVSSCGGGGGCGGSGGGGDGGGGG